MKKLLLVIALLLGGFSTAKSQKDSVNLVTVQWSPEIYIREAYLILNTSMLVKFISPKQDTVYIGSKISFSKEKAPNDLNNCVSYADTLGTQSIFVVVIKDLKLIWSKELSSRGQSEILNQRIILASGDVLVLREIYRRRFDCGFYLFYTVELAPRTGT